MRLVKRNLLRSPKYKKTFSEIDGLVSYLTILDISASFEVAFREELKNAVGEARKAARNNYDIDTLSRVRESLVHNIEFYGGFGGIESLLKAHLDDTLVASLKAIRENRNRFAHGTDVEIAPTILAHEVVAALVAIAEYL
ncbi:MAG: hypothetical protein JOY94_02055 [Methylobacteriaceae bacterium]|nr:hypothetical protein [Methylobacteriaceae bacterium]